MLVHASCLGEVAVDHLSAAVFGEGRPPCWQQSPVKAMAAATVLAIVNDSAVATKAADTAPTASTANSAAGAAAQPPPS